MQNRVAIDIKDNPEISAYGRKTRGEVNSSPDVMEALMYALDDVLEYMKENDCNDIHIDGDFELPNNQIGRVNIQIEPR